jgi:hypothetical protein
MPLLPPSHPGAAEDQCFFRTCQLGWLSSISGYHEFLLFERCRFDMNYG